MLMIGRENSIEQVYSKMMTNYRYSTQRTSNGLHGIGELGITKGNSNLVEKWYLVTLIIL